MMILDSVNWLAVVTAAAAYFLVGGLWYSQALFGSKWPRLMGWSRDEMAAHKKDAPNGYLAAIVASLLMAYVLALVMPAFGDIFGSAVMAAVILWLGFMGGPSFVSYIFEGRPMALWAINSGYNLVGLIAISIVLGLWG